MGKPFKLDAIELDTKEPFEFEWDGQVFTCIDPNTVDIRRVSDVLTDAGSDLEGSLAFMLGGEDEYARLDATGGVFTAVHMKRLSEEWVAHYGLDLPKSGGSAKRSKSTRMR